MYDHEEWLRNNEKRIENFKKRMNRMEEQRMESLEKVATFVLGIMVILLFGGLYLHNQVMFYAGLGMLALMGIIAHLK